MDQTVLSENVLLKRAHSILNSQRQQPYGPLKPKQIDSVMKGAKSKHLCILATGYGKTLVKELLPIYTAVCRCEGTVTGSVTVIISPLNAIIQQQKQLRGRSAILVKRGKLQFQY